MNNDYGNLQLHKVLLRAMKDIDSICREHGLKYYLHAGTLLGAVNHKGFIPWDDDVDISFLRADYDKFIKIMESSPSEYYHIQTYKNDKNHKNNRAVLRIKGTAVYHGDGTSFSEAGIDIVPLDYAPDSRLLQKIQANIIRILDLAVQIKFGDVIPQSIVTRCISLLSKIDRVKLGKMIDFVSQLANKRERKKLGLLTYTFKEPYNNLNPYDHDLCDSELYMNPIMIPFEDTEFMTISNPDADLTRRYTSKYKEPFPEEKRITKHGVTGYKVESWVMERCNN